MEGTLELKVKDILIENIARYYSELDIYSVGRKIGIGKEVYSAQGLTSLRLAENFVDVVFRKGLEKNLIKIIEKDSYLSRDRIIENLKKISYGLNMNNLDDECESPKIILNLSDIHMEKSEDVKKYLIQLKTDLIRSKGIRDLDYIVISGDITQTASENEFKLAYDFLSSIINDFNVSKEKIIVVPGNHDVDWFTCKKSVDKDGNIIDVELYNKKFSNFSEYFYKLVCGYEYPLNPDNQGILKIIEDDKIIFLGLNSSYDIDHINKLRSGINMGALYNSLDTLLESEEYDTYKKIAVFHHPTSGEGQMNDDFIEILIKNQFEICMHGHIHKSNYDFSKYDTKLGINIIGAGTFGAPTKEQVAGIPLQYNIVELYKNKVIVNTRKKEKINGSWTADARWGDKENPLPSYEFKI